MPFVSVSHTSSNRLLLSNQDKGCTPSVAHSPALPLGPALLNLWNVISDLTPYQNLNQRSLTPRWPLTPSLLRSYVWHYPRIIVSKSHENTSKYVDTMTFFSKPWTKGHLPLDDLWPQVCWGHMCDSTQGSLCPSVMKILQSVWIWWPFFKNLNQRSLTPRWPLTSCLLRSHVTLPKGHCVQVPWEYINFCGYNDRFCKMPHTTYYIHTYYIHVQNEWSHSLWTCSDETKTVILLLLKK